MNGPSSNSALYRNRLLFLVGVIAGLLLGAWFYFSNQPQIPGLPEDVGKVAAPLSPDEVAQLVHDAHVATAHLENADLEIADALFLKIAEQVPEEALPIRNLAIGRFLAYDAGTGNQAAVEEALDRLRKEETAAATTAWLDAKTALKASEVIAATDPDASAQLLRRATESLEAAELRDPAFAGFPYQLFEATRFNADPEATRRGEAALGRAYRLAPDNLFVLGEWLLVQVENQDATIRENLEASKATIAPLRKQIQDNVRIDIFEMVDQAIEAAKQGNWPVVRARVRGVFVNSMRSHEFAQNDLKRLKPHPLEFVLQEFSPAFQEKYARPPVSAPAIEVTFTPLPARQQLPVIDDAVDMVAVDFDLNGTQDMVVLRASTVDVYGQTQPGSDWQLLTTREIPAGMRGLLVADLDHDRDHAIAHENVKDGGPSPLKPQVCFAADVDVVIYGDPGLLVLRNELDSEGGQRTLVPVEQPAGLEVPAAHHGVLVDFDHDSNLDVVLATERGIVALLALGNLTFTDATTFSQMPSADHPVTSLVPVDWDRDADIDIVATAPEGGLIGYLDNKRHGNFRWVDFEREFAELKGATSLALLDCDGNASWDLVGIGAAGLQLVRTHSSPTGGPGALRGWHEGDLKFAGLTLFDFDNDGYQDVLAWGDEGIVVYRGAADGTFAARTGMFGEAPVAVRKCDVADFDADGDQDVVVLTDQGLLIYSNEGGNQNHWLEIRTLGLVDNKGKSNHNGIGGLVEIKAGDRYQAQVVHRPVTHFGLGELEKADVIRFLWPNGVPQAEVEPATNQAICETMILKGSCPYLYTWTGNKFEFFTDLLWAAPIGLQFADGILAPAREWEYLLIPGDRLKARDRQYVVQVTEELWEAAYFESIELIAVDHPADVNVFTNEKVGPADIAAPQIHTVRNRQTPVAARDKHARDVLPEILNRDGTYMRGYDKRIVPGLVDEHYLELDLGDLEQARQIKLFLTGWIYPTDTSLNVALSRHPELDGPQPPAIQVPDAEGKWRETIPYMGFPGGKTKTIVVDLSQAFLTDDYRLRIVTTGEFYWDEVFFTVDEQPAEIRQTPLALRSADLHYRGFSRALPPRENSPEVYEYQDVSPARKWPPMDGRFTKFGDVLELLADGDDRLVVMGAGDELTLTFAEPDLTLPAGWVRDFVIHNVGWDKDADMNTVYGQSVEPLPFVGMRRYPFPIDQQLPDSTSYRDYLRRYQTRTQKHHEFWNAIREY